MPDTLSIGDFSRATHLTVKTLRYYHRTGLLEPADVDPHTGYRRYTVDQISYAQIIRRLRDLDMPVEQVQALLAAPDLGSRNRLMAEHLAHLETQLARTGQQVASLRDLLTPQTPGPPVVRRQMAQTPAAGMSDTVDTADAFVWLEGALGELHAVAAAQGLTVTGPAGALYANEIFTDGRGTATVFLPCVGPVRAVGRVVPLIVPAAELAIIQHAGPHDDVDRSYGQLAAYVSRHAVAVEGPIREYYVVARHENPDPACWLTDIGWPIFHTGPGMDDVS